jgi:hypothetical protein
MRGSAFCWLVEAGSALVTAAQPAVVDGRLHLSLLFQSTLAEPGPDLSLTYRGAAVLEVFDGERPVLRARTGPTRRRTESSGSRSSRTGGAWHLRGSHAALGRPVSGRLISGTQAAV